MDLVEKIISGEAIFETARLLASDDGLSDEAAAELGNVVLRYLAMPEKTGPEFFTHYYVPLWTLAKLKHPPKPALGALTKVIEEERRTIDALTYAINALARLEEYAKPSVPALKNLLKFWKDGYTKSVKKEEAQTEVMSDARIGMIYCAFGLARISPKDARPLIPLLMNEMQLKREALPRPNGPPPREKPRYDDSGMLLPASAEYQQAIRKFVQFTAYECRVSHPRASAAGTLGHLKATEAAECLHAALEWERDPNVVDSIKFSLKRIESSEEIEEGEVEQFYEDHIINTLPLPSGGGSVSTLEATRTLTAVEILEQQCVRVDQVQADMRTRINEILSALAGQEFPSIEAKKEVVAKVNRLLNVAEAKLKCPNCGNPAVLKAIMTGTSKTGVFRFGHTRTGKVHGAKVAFPEGLTVIEE